MQRAQEILRTVFGYKEFRRQQAEIIQTMIDGKDVLTTILPKNVTTHPYPHKAGRKVSIE
jgi:hypothetical protein